MPHPPSSPPSHPRVGALFAGYGGLDLAVRDVFGGHMAWYSEINEGALKILGHRFPGVPNVGSVTEADWSQVEPVDILTGGFPCQDISSAGRKAGVRNGKRSGLWASMARAIGDLRPGLVVVENVRELLVRGLDVVLGDLSELGYDAQWTTVSACRVGAPFARVRLFITASPAGADRTGLGRLPQLHGVPQQASPIRLEWQQRHANRLAVADQRALDRWAQLLGRPAPDPLERGVNGQPRLTAAFEEWLMGLPAGWVTDVPGITRNEALKALGNGVVPQQAAAALWDMLAPLDFGEAVS